MNDEIVKLLKRVNHRAKSKREALSNLLARLRTWETQPWRVQVDQ